MMNRRRFLAIAASTLAAPAAAAVTEPQVWSRLALGAEVRITLRDATPQLAARAFAKVESRLRIVEDHFSLYRDSALTRLNRTGRLAHPPPAMLQVLRLSAEIHAATGGMFDPTVQPLWLAVAGTGDVEGARRLIGWRRVRVSEQEIALEPGMQLTFNGIAQGHAADEVAALLQGEGFGDVLIDTGEIIGLGARPDGYPWRAGIALPNGDVVGQAALSNRALATSSPLGTRIGSGRPHILDPRGDGPPAWQLASVSAGRAALADGLSTAFCLMDRPAIHKALDRFPEARLEALI
jgi:thiamine biosynthesis lipoprotein